MLWPVRFILFHIPDSISNFPALIHSKIKTARFYCCAPHVFTQHATRNTFFKMNVATTPQFND